MFRYDFWVWVDTALIVAVITLIGTVIQFIVAPLWAERCRAKKNEEGQ